MNALLCTLHLLVVLIPGLVFLTARPISRRISLIACATSLGLAGLLVLIFPANAELVTLSIAGTHVMVLDELSLWLLPFTLSIYLSILLCTPREYRRPGATDEMLLGLSLDLAFFSMHSPLWLAVLWPLTHIPLVLAIRRSVSEPARLLRILTVFLLPGCLLFMAGAVVCGLSEAGHTPLWALLLLTAGIAVRKAIVPFHQWITELFEEGPLGPCIAFTSPQLGAYATVRLLAQNAPDSSWVWAWPHSLPRSTGPAWRWGSAASARLTRGFGWGRPRWFLPGCSAPPTPGWLAGWRCGFPVAWR